MKKILLLTALCSLSVFNWISAQNTNNVMNLSESEYISIYTGSWEYKNVQTNEIFTVKLWPIRKINESDNTGFSYMFFGTCSYSKNGKVIFDNLKDIEEAQKIKGLQSQEFYLHVKNDYPITCYCRPQSGLYKALITYDDPVTHCPAEGTIKLTDVTAGSEKLLLKMSESEQIGPPIYEGFSIPLTMTLTKVH